MPDILPSDRTFEQDTLISVQRTGKFPSQIDFDRHKHCRLSITHDTRGDIDRITPRRKTIWTLMKREQEMVIGG